MRRLLRRRVASSATAGRGPGPLLPALVLVALVPALCVLWFMSAAIRNEQLAVQQRFSTLYSNHLMTVQRRLDSFWKDRAATLEALATHPPAQRFAVIVLSNLADSAVIYDGAGRPTYPGEPEVNASAATETRADWQKARELEFQKLDYRAAAERYRQIATGSTKTEEQARATQSEANSRLKAGDKQGAGDTLRHLVDRIQPGEVVGALGELVRPNVQLRLLKLWDDVGHPSYRTTLEDLTASLNDYRGARMPASQRLFLMEELRALAPDQVEFPTVAAERIAAAYLETSPNVSPSGRLERTGLPQVWQFATSGGQVVALYREDSLRREADKLLSEELALFDAQVRLLAPNELAAGPTPIPLVGAGEVLPGWRLLLSFAGPDPFAKAARQQTLRYWWTGSLTLVVIALVTALLSRYVSAQMRVTRIKDELVSAVSHELKTPLANIRALVDTMLAGRCRSPEQQHAYLASISDEGLRLTHLIDNFLVFSRTEQDRHRFHFAELDPRSLLTSAVEAAKRRFQPHAVDFQVAAQSALPSLRADPDALTMVLVNLLDNAYKYTGDDKRIILRAYVDAAHRLAFEVQDNGVGLNKEERSKVFDRFYQADQSLTRRRGGCGLGLSIVQYIVRAHGGTVQVESEPGKGSIFRVTLPLPGSATQGGWS